jgi:hypothetical protein
MPIIKNILRFFTSLKLTCVLLAFAIIVVFIGTVAQVDEGLYGAQAHYFRQWVILGANLFGKKVPLVLPGGYLVGTLLLVNLVSSHIYKFQLKTSKLGIQLAHTGVILLLAGQMMTDLLSRELQLQLTEGQSKDFSESVTDYELVFASGDQVTAIPHKLLKPGTELKIGSLPFTIRVKTSWKHSDVSFRAPMMRNAPPIASNGVALNFDFRQLPEIKTMNEKNIPTAIIELVTPNGSLGDWVVSDWTGDAGLVTGVQNGYAQQLGPDMAHEIATQLAAPQSVTVNGARYTFVMRPARLYQGFSLTLLKATHTVYPGTDIPKDFRSHLQLDNAKTGEKRDVEVSMNHPLRYAGLTFYQYQMDAGQVAEQAGRVPSSVLSVVRNPSWLTPYIGCSMVGAGLLIQFLLHLIKFTARRKT